MAAQGYDYLNCPVLVYCEEGDYLVRTVIINFDKGSMQIQLETMPGTLEIGDNCKLLILTEPSPQEYLGRVRTTFWGKSVALYKGRQKEDRGATRYKVSFKARVEYLVNDGRAEALETPLEIKLVNISTTGMRFLAPLKALRNGDKFQTRVTIGSDLKLLIAEVVNHREDEDSEIAEYGCRFLIAG